MNIIESFIQEQIKSLGIATSIPGIKRLTVSSIMKQLAPATFSQFSANSILGAFKKAGFGVRRQWFLQQFRYSGTSAGVFARQATTQRGDQILVRDMPITDINLRHKYSYQLEMMVQGYTSTSPATNRDVDEFAIQKYFFGSDKAMSPREVEKAFTAKFKDTSMSSIRADWSSLVFKRATKRGQQL